MKNIVEKINRSGFIEFLYIGIGIIFEKIRSYFWICVLRLRGYDIDSSVILGKGISFFQGEKKSIKVGKKSFIENGVRIRAGFKGKIYIGKNVRIHDSVFIFAHRKLTIGDNTMISHQVTITDFNHKSPYSEYKDMLKNENAYTSNPVKIGENVWIGAQSIILPGVSIGDNAVIGAGSVVTKNIPIRSVAFGNPAKVIKKI